MTGSTNHHVAVVGGGFTGVVAARELAARGHRVTLIEARNRLGGRAWTTSDNTLGRRLEIGGTHVHWSQPHLWAEITRYGLTVVPLSVPQHGSWLVGGELTEGSVEDLNEALGSGLDAYMAGASDHFPLPYAPLTELDDVTALDGQSAADRIPGLGLDDARSQLLDAMWSLNFCGPAENGSLAKALHLAALGNEKASLLNAALDDYKLLEGTSALIQAIAEDQNIEVVLDQPVVSVRDIDGVVSIETSDGAVVEADRIVVTVPTTVLTSIAFEPALDPVWTSIAEYGQVSRGVKVWVRAKVDDPRPWFGVATRPHPITFARLETTFDDGTVLLRGFGLDAEAFDVADIGAAQKAFESLIPGIEVVECFGHDWMTDPYSMETWPFYSRGFMTKVLQADKTHGNVHLAGTLLAAGWSGYIDGAIESGITTARAVDRSLDLQQ